MRKLLVRRCLLRRRRGVRARRRLLQPTRKVEAVGPGVTELPGPHVLAAARELSARIRVRRGVGRGRTHRRLWLRRRRLLPKRIRRARERKRITGRRWLVCARERPEAERAGHTEVRLDVTRRKQARHLLELRHLRRATQVRPTLCSDHARLLRPPGRAPLRRHARELLRPGVTHSRMEDVHLATKARLLLLLRHVPRSQLILVRVL
jgi:hypothetical protein